MQWGLLQGGPDNWVLDIVDAVDQLGFRLLDLDLAVEKGMHQQVHVAIDGRAEHPAGASDVETAKIASSAHEAHAERRSARK